MDASQDVQIDVFMTGSVTAVSAPRLKLKAQVMVGDDIALGPGKVELLEWVDRQGSISGAARAMGLSYRRAWMMVDTMNRCFETPLVSRSHGGAKGGGATLTEAGKAAVKLFRALEAELAVASATYADRLTAMLPKPVNASPRR